MTDLAWILYKTSVKTQWDLNYKGDYLSVINWWSPTLVNGERIILNEKVILDEFYWLPKFSSTYELNLEDGQLVKVILKRNAWGAKVCHIYINDELLGGDIHQRMI